MTENGTVGDQTTSSAKDRLLLAAAHLLEGGNRTLSTRAICDLAGVKAPTLYHHFGNKQGLIDAVIHHGFSQYVSSDGPLETASDPVRDLRDGWDRHVEFGLQHPTFYALLYGDVVPGVPCTITAPATRMLVGLLEAAARRGLLTVPPADAAAQILAANVGVTLSLITQPDGVRDLALSERVRAAALAAVLIEEQADEQPDGEQSDGEQSDGAQPAEPRVRAANPPSRATAAIALNAALGHDPSGLSAGELTLMKELLDRLAGQRPPS